MEHLVFRLYGPMAAWGDIAVGEMRPSAVRPSKSAILGLLCAALGIKREQDVMQLELQQSVGFSVQVVNTGHLLRDYHTTQVPPAKKGQHRYTRADELAATKLATILSTRDYRCDAVAVVCLWLREGATEYTLQTLRSALLKPVFPLFLGRKSCPVALPLLPQVVEAESLAAAFPAADFPAVAGIVTTGVDVYWEEHPTPGIDELSRSARRDKVLSRRRWQFLERMEYHGRLTPKETAEVVQ